MIEAKIVPPPFTPSAIAYLSAYLLLHLWEQIRSSCSYENVMTTAKEGILVEGGGRGRQVHVQR